MNKTILLIALTVVVIIVIACSENLRVASPSSKSPGAKSEGHMYDDMKRNEDDLRNADVTINISKLEKHDCIIMTFELVNNTSGTITVSRQGVAAAFLHAQMTSPLGEQVRVWTGGLGATMSSRDFDYSLEVRPGEKEQFEQAILARGLVTEGGKEVSGVVEWMIDWSVGAKILSPSVEFKELHLTGKGSIGISKS